MMKINQNKIILKKNQKNKKIKNLIQNNQNHILIIEIILIIKNLININKNFIIILIKIAIFTIISKEIIIHKKEIEKAEVEIEVDIIDIKDIEAIVLKEISLQEKIIIRLQGKEDQITMIIIFMIIEKVMRIKDIQNKEDKEIRNYKKN